LVGLATCLLLLVFILFVSLDAWVAGVFFLAIGTVYYSIHKRMIIKQAKTA